MQRRECSNAPADTQRFNALGDGLEISRNFRSHGPNVLLDDSLYLLSENFAGDTVARVVESDVINRFVNAEVWKEQATDQMHLL